MNGNIGRAVVNRYPGIIQMRDEFVNSFISATQDVFSMMLSCELSRGPLGSTRSHSPEYEVSGFIGLSGKCQGMFVVSLGRHTAMLVAEAMLGQRPDDLDAEVVDAVGELTNMIAGAAKTKLEELSMCIGLPTVVCGSQHAINFPSKMVPIYLPFDSQFGPISIEFGIVESPP